MTHHYGPHIDPPLAAIPAILREMGCTIFQTTLRNPVRLSKEGIPDAQDQGVLAAMMASDTDLWGMAHASLLTNLASPDPRIRNGSAGALVQDAGLAAELGLAGVCFHVGYAKGHASQQAALDAVVSKLSDVVGRLAPGARVFLENGAEGSELGQTVAELGYVIRAVGSPPEKLGVVLDTCHLHVAGFDMAQPDAAERLAEEVQQQGLAERLVGLHLNDAQFPCGSKRDRHAVPGEGTIGEGLLRLVHHPLFAGLPCVLEVPVEDAARGIAYLEHGKK
ncbi:MAG: deoxyribonuclease IV [Chthonomonadales bacterium]